MRMHLHNENQREKKDLDRRRVSYNNVPFTRMTLTDVTRRANP